jgi:hypothetical protein
MATNLSKLEKARTEAQKKHAEITNRVGVLIDEIRERKATMGAAILAGEDPTKYGDDLAKLEGQLSALQAAKVVASQRECEADEAHAAEALKEAENYLTKLRGELESDEKALYKELDRVRVHAHNLKSRAVAGQTFASQRRTKGSVQDTQGFRVEMALTAFFNDCAAYQIPLAGIGANAQGDLNSYIVLDEPK